MLMFGKNPFEQNPFGQVNDPEVIGKQLSMSQLTGGIGPTPGSDVSKDYSDVAGAGISVGGSLLGQLLKNRADRQSLELSSKLGGMRQQMESEQAARLQAGQASQNALARLMQNYRAALT